MVIRWQNKNRYIDACRKKIVIVLLLATILVVSITMGAILTFLDKIETNRIEVAIGE